MLDRSLDLNGNSISVSSVSSSVGEKDLSLTDSRRENVVDIGIVGRFVSFLNGRVRRVGRYSSTLIRFDICDELLSSFFSEESL